MSTTAIVKACSVATFVKNTGVTCNKAMLADAMIIACPPGMTFTDEDLADPLTWIKGLIHNPPATRCYPIFGQKAPIRTYDPKNESDVIVVMDDGSSHFLRYGFSNVNYETTNGGLCYAQALASFNAAGYNFLRIDKAGTMLAGQAADGTYYVLNNDFAYAPAPQGADLKTTPYKNKFMISYDPQDMIDNGVLLSGAKPFLSLMGLIDVGVFCDNPNITGTYVAAVAATGNVTITAIGADGDTIDVKVGGVSISGGPVAKTSAETTVTLFATKVKNAINAAALAAGGGITATNVSGSITLIGLKSDGVFTTLPTATIAGTITATFVAFSGGVQGYIKVEVRVLCTGGDLVTLLGDQLANVANFSIVDRSDSSVQTIKSATIVDTSKIKLEFPLENAKSYTISGAIPSVLFANGVIGYDISQSVNAPH